MKKVESSGGVLFNLNGKEIRVYLAKHTDYGFVLPKGTKEQKETWLNTAIREVKEETGYTVKNPKYEIGTIKYSFTKNNMEFDKEVRFFAFEIKDPNQRNDLQLEKDERIIKGKWVEIENAIELLSHESEKSILRKFKNLPLYLSFVDKTK